MPALAQAQQPWHRLGQTTFGHQPSRPQLPGEHGLPLGTIGSGQTVAADGRCLAGGEVHPAKTRCFTLGVALEHRLQQDLQGPPQAFETLRQPIKIGAQLPRQRTDLDDRLRQRRVDLVQGLVTPLGLPGRIRQIGRGPTQHRLTRLGGQRADQFLDPGQFFHPGDHHVHRQAEAEPLQQVDKAPPDLEAQLGGVLDVVKGAQRYGPDHRIQWPLAAQAQHQPQQAPPVAPLPVHAVIGQEQRLGHHQHRALGIGKPAPEPSRLVGRLQAPLGAQLGAVGFVAEHHQPRHLIAVPGALLLLHAAHRPIETADRRPALGPQPPDQGRDQQHHDDGEHHQGNDAQGAHESSS
ncbi:hypothetical protein D3C78_1093810 [compost metagenome]